MRDINIAEYRAKTKKYKYVDIRACHLQHHIIQENFRIRYISSLLNRADNFTKPVVHTGTTVLPGLQSNPMRHGPRAQRSVDTLTGSILLNQQASINLDVSTREAKRRTIYLKIA